MTHHIAQLNIGLAKGEMDGPVMAGFAAELDRINGIADSSHGFVWRLQTEDGDATAIRPYENERMMVNMSVWESIEELRDFVYRSGHVEIMRRRREWFERVFDLYCGIGTIGLSMAPRAASVAGLELIPEAVADAIANARLNEIDNARFFAGDVRLALRELVETAGRPDLLVVDPPRAGLSQKVVRRIIEAAPNRVVYVSCNPTTLAPNAAQLTEAGYQLKRVRLVDMFPQTPHIECVALLERA